MVNSENETLPVLVVGAGPVGLIMALDLKLRGIKCRIIDKLPAASDKSKALGIHARTLELLEMMGIVDEFLKIGVKVHATNIACGDKTLVHLCFDEMGGQYPYALMIPQSETERLLTEQLNKHALQIEREVELLSISQDAKAVTATLKHADGKEEIVKANWLIGCDGAHSTTRHLLGLKFEGEQYEEPFATADCHVEWDKAEDVLNGFVSDEGTVFFFPMGDHRYRIAADGSKPPTNDLTLEEMQAIVDRRCLPGIRLHNPNWLTWFTVNHRSVAQYRQGRVFVSGDAAHVHSPMMGQGMNTGMQDAINLAWKIELVEKGIARDDLLDSYQEERHPIGQAVLKNTDIMTKIVTVRNPIAQDVRNKLMPILAGQDVVQHRAWRTLSMLGLNYRTSPIVGEHRSGITHSIPTHPVADVAAWLDFNHGPLPGDRAPDGKVVSANDNEPTRLLEAIRGTNHNVLLFAGPQHSREALSAINKALAEIEKAYEFINCHVVVSKVDDDLEMKSAHSILLDADGSLHHTYGAAHACLYLIRPDGYIGFRCQPIEFAQLKQHLEKVFGARVRAKASSVTA